MSDYDIVQNGIQKLSDEEIWTLYAHVNLILKERKLVRTRNITGERGEFLAIAKYNSTPGLPNLQAAPEGTQNVDALSRKGDRYSIKTISEPGNTTGAFHGLGNPEESVSDRKFEFVIIVVLDSNLKLKRLIEISWDKFLNLRKWHSTMRAWNLNITKELLKQARIIFPATEDIELNNTNGESV